MGSTVSLFVARSPVSCLHLQKTVSMVANELTLDKSIFMEHFEINGAIVKHFIPALAAWLQVVWRFSAKSSE
jgi:hypothetical protein